MLRVGLTGGIGSGKTELAKLFSGRRIPLLDLDAVGRALHSDADCITDLVTAFGDGILASDKTIDRRALAAICFADAEKTAQLNRIMHPRIWAQTDAWCARQNASYVLIEASVLIESGGASRMDAVIVVLADEVLRRQRVLASRHLDAAQFDAIVRRQCNDADRRQAADFIVENNAGLDALAFQVEALQQKIMARAVSSAG
ncbi:MAG: dephospho-CoA kinase [Mariprofundaceae bacterium]